MRKLQKEEANRAIGELFGLPEDTVVSFVITIKSDDGDDMFSSMCCDKHTWLELISTANSIAIQATQNPN